MSREKIAQDLPVFNLSQGFYTLFLLVFARAGLAIDLLQDQFAKNSRVRVASIGVADPAGVALISNTRVSLPLKETSPM